MSEKCNQKTYTFEVSRGVGRGTDTISVSVNAENKQKASSRLRELMDSEGYEVYRFSLFSIAEHRCCKE